MRTPSVFTTSSARSGAMQRNRTATAGKPRRVSSNAWRKGAGSTAERCDARAVIRKGHHADVDSYSAFLEADRTTPTGLAGYLRDTGVTRVWCCGLATDYCVAWSALDARAAGFDVIVIEDAARAIDLSGSLD